MTSGMPNTRIQKSRDFRTFFMTIRKFYQIFAPEADTTALLFRTQYTRTKLVKPGEYRRSSDGFILFLFVFIRTHFPNQSKTTFTKSSLDKATERKHPSRHKHALLKTLYDAFERLKILRKLSGNFLCAVAKRL